MTVRTSDNLCDHFSSRPGIVPHINSRFTLLILALALLGGCAKKRPVAAIPQSIGWTETGEASWYGNPYHGRQAASGEIFDMNKMTAAHQTLPFNTWVRVRNLTNDKTVDVRITDRGPFAHGRIIDLSRAAASAIDMIGPGVAKVRIQVISAPVAVDTGRFAVQVGVFADRRNAERLADRMRKTYDDARLVTRHGAQIQWRVLVGQAPTEEDADLLAARLRKEFGTVIVVRLDDIQDEN
jgi:peptidoglycan lytic transglycosylase